MDLLIATDSCVGIARKEAFSAEKRRGELVALSNLLAGRERSLAMFQMGSFLGAFFGGDEALRRMLVELISPQAPSLTVEWRAPLGGVTCRLRSWKGRC